MKKSAIIIMAKQPIEGKTKTRMTPHLSHNQAAALFEALVKDTIDLCAQVDQAELAIAISPPKSISYFRKISPPNTILVPAVCQNIGDCLNQVLTHLLSIGFESAFAINADGPTLPLEYLHQALSLIEDHDLVLGPSYDGGYYLIGLKQPAPEIFEHIAWSTEEVLAQTITQAKKHGLAKYALLPEWYDVDNIDTLNKMSEELKTLPPSSLKHTRLFLENNQFNE